MSAELIAQALAEVRRQRELWVDLGDGRRVRGRIAATSMSLLPGSRVEFLLRQADAWDGFTLGDVSPSMPEPARAMPFSVDLWCELAELRPEWGTRFAAELASASLRHQERREEVSGN